MFRTNVIKRLIRQPNISNQHFGKRIQVQKFLKVPVSNVHWSKTHEVLEVFIEDDVFTLLKISKDKGRNLSQLMNELQYCFHNYNTNTLSMDFSI